MGFTFDDTAWNESYNLRDKEIDLNRKKVLGLCQSYLEQKELPSEDEKKAILKRIIDELSFYLSTQFILEQEFYTTNCYPNKDEHKEKHKKIAETYNNFLAKLGELSFSEVEENLGTILEQEFLNHIIHEDCEYNSWNDSLDSFQKTFEWEQEFEIGDDVVDAGNKELFKITEEAFHDAPCQNSRDEKIRNTVNYIYNYLKVNFQHEEALMKEYEYPRMAQHLLRHRNIIKQMNRLVVQLPKTDTKYFEKQLANILEATFVYHVMDEDEGLRKWIREAQ